jgi:hypothetical protein
VFTVFSKLFAPKSTSETASKMADEDYENGAPVMAKFCPLKLPVNKINIPHTARRD